MPVIWQSLTASHLTITPEGYSRTISKILTAKSISELLGQRSGTAWSGRTGEHPHRAFLSRRQSLLAASPQPARFYYHSCDTDSVRESKRFGPKARPSLRSIFRSTPSLCVKIRHRNKSAYSGHCFSLNCWEYWRERKDQPRDISNLYPPGWILALSRNRTQLARYTHLDHWGTSSYASIENRWYMNRYISQNCTDVLRAGSSFPVEYRGQTRYTYYTTIFDWKPLMGAYHRIGHRLESLRTFFAQYESSRSSTSNVRSEKLKIRTDPGDWGMDEHILCSIHIEQVIYLKREKWEIEN